jgi:large subunit ribosomal protein L24
MHFRKDDTVQIITGEDAGTTARVLRVLGNERKVVVEGVNRVYKHMKASQQNRQGGRLEKEMPIDASNVLLYCATCKKGVRVGHRYDAEGKKERFCKKCSAGLGALSKARPAYAKKKS